MVMSLRRFTSTAAVLALFSALPAKGADEPTIDSDALAGLEARAIGPATMSGRIAAIDALEGDRLTIYVGAASGGVWKSVDGGLQFKPIFDKYTQSIGAITIDRKDPKTVWVGTGESWMRNSVSVGDGVYKSTDRGDTWQHLGLPESEHIGRIAIDPKDSNTVFVCALGHAFGANPERGVFRTKDGGKNWEKVLFVNEDTGCADLAIDAQDGRTLYAGMWQFRRKPYFFTSGGPGGGLYRSTDGGTTWKKSQEGLPKRDLGRIALAVAPSQPGVLYATVEAKDETALYRSQDSGASFAPVAKSRAVTGRPFYFSRLVADPKDPNRVYKMGFQASISEDGGKTFSALGGGGPLGGSYHGDTHDLWINPARTDELILGTDGGVYISDDRGTHWRFVGSLPVGQFYHVSYDMAVPYNVYGGLQDNSTWWGPSRRPGGIANKHWEAGLPCDGFWAFPDPKEADIWYAECQGGGLARLKKSTQEIKDIQPTPNAGEPKYRFNWNSPIALSPHDPETLYFAAQRLFRSRNRGDSWEVISPDLTTNDPARQKQHDSGGLTPDDSTAENHCTIFTVAESPKNRDLLWVGTDDGNLQVTRDGGKTWSNVTANLTGLPKYDLKDGAKPFHPWVTSVEPSHVEEGTAYATLDGHFSGDAKTYVYKTTDYGKTWQNVATPVLKGYAHVVREDPVNSNLVFLGTEQGLFMSFDAGRGWAQFTGNFPNVAVRDVVIHPRDHDLVIATHGRGLYILDDLTPLRDLTPQALSADVTILKSRAQEMPIPAFDFASSNGDSEFMGTVPQEAAYITYYLKKRHIIGDLKLEIYDKDLKLLSTIPGGKRRGLNRVPWPMRLPPPKLPPATQAVFLAAFGPRVLPGPYTVKMIKGKDLFTSQVELLADRRSTYTPEDRALQHETSLKLYAMLERMTIVVDAITDARDQARTRAEPLPKGDALRKRLDSFAAAMEERRQSLVSVKEGEVVSGEDKLRENLGDLYGNVNFNEGRPTLSQLNRLSVLGKDLDAAAAKFKDAVDKDLSSLNAALKAKKLEAITPLSEEEWRKRQQK
jgi:photosystem II stability/assembly factor-like uncharacterized protein